MYIGTLWTIFFNSFKIRFSYHKIKPFKSVQCLRIPIFHFLVNICYCCLFHSSHPSECDRDFHFPNDQWYWAFLHLLIGQSHIFFGEISIEMLLPFFNWKLFNALWILVPYLISSLQMFSSIPWVISFIFLMVSIESQKSLMLMKSTFFMCCLCLWYLIYIIIV